MRVELHEKFCEILVSCTQAIYTCIMLRAKIAHEQWPMCSFSSHALPPLNPVLLSTQGFKLSIAILELCIELSLSPLVEMCVHCIKLLSKVCVKQCFEAIVYVYNEAHIY